MENSSITKPRAVATALRVTGGAPFLYGYQPVPKIPFGILVFKGLEVVRVVRRNLENVMSEKMMKIVIEVTRNTNILA